MSRPGGQPEAISQLRAAVLTIIGTRLDSRQVDAGMRQATLDIAEGILFLVADEPNPAQAFSRLWKRVWE